MDILAYVGAAALVVLAILAYRYWRSTAAYAHRVRESRARRVRDSYRATVVEPPPAEPATSPPETDSRVEVPPLNPERNLSEEKIVATEDPPAEQADPISDVIESGPEEAETDEQPPPGSTPSAEVPPGSEANLPDAREDTAERVSEPEEPESGAAFRLIEELEPNSGSAAATNKGRAPELLKELDEELAALPGGIELMDLPLLERRRVADRREELKNDRARLLEQRKRGAHRRKGRGRNNSGP